MPKQNDRVSVRGSDRAAPLHGAKRVGPVPPSERFEVTIRVRRQTPLAGFAAPSALDATPPGKRKYLSRAEYGASHGASRADLDAVAEFARSHGLTVLETSGPRRSVFVSGTADAYAKAFGTDIGQFEHEGGTYRGREGELTVPAEVAPLIEGVFGIDDRPVAKPHFQRQLPSPSFGIESRASTNGSFLPTEIAKLYNFPTGVDGSGECIGIIELGGGYRKADIDAYFKKLNVKKPPLVRTVRVDGGHNQPSTPDSADGEVMLDILVAGAVAPGAEIAVYFAPNTDKGFLDALTMAIHDTRNKPSVISISWGSAESNWTQQAMTSFDQALQTAAALGVTVCAAAGDNGSADGVADGHPHVDFPASSPFMLACGGTRLTGSGASISSEKVWNVSPASATGGGLSAFFQAPDYQVSADIPLGANGGAKHRGVPDVAGDADPNSGYQIRIDGQDAVIGGTSAVAPLWAGLIALMNQKLGHSVGFLNPLIYAAPARSIGFHDITEGDNGDFAAEPGWDACTGWGSPDGARLLNALS